MSFKKTPDGKVFFQGANTNTARDEGLEVEDMLAEAGGRFAGAETQLQILALLRALNDKLRTTQVQHSKFDNQLETFRTLLEGLDGRTEANEKALASFGGKLVPNSNAAGDARMNDVENTLNETRAELQRIRQIFLKGGDVRELPDAAYRDALGGLARAEQLLASEKQNVAAARAQEPARQAYFSAFYAVALSLVLISGAVFVWGVTGYDKTRSTAPKTIVPANNTSATTEQSDDQLLKLMESNPDALAAQMNKLEPSSVPDAGAVSVRGLIDPDMALPRAYKELEDKAFNGSMEAQHNLAALYTATNGPVKQNYERAVFWFRQAAERGMANAQYNLGVMYHQGLGVPKDLTQAMSWYKAAAAQHHAEAEYNLGIGYIEGIGVEYDPSKAVQNFEDAARLGVVEASYNLGLIYENALLGRADPSKALAWYKKAAEQGSPEATAALEQLARTLDIEVKDIDRVVGEAGKL